MPAMCGAAMLVPEISANPSPAQEWKKLNIWFLGNVLKISLGGKSVIAIFLKSDLSGSNWFKPS